MSEDQRVFITKSSLSLVYKIALPKNLFEQQNIPNLHNHAMQSAKVLQLFSSVYPLTLFDFLNWRTSCAIDYLPSFCVTL